MVVCVQVVYVQCVGARENEFELEGSSLLWRNADRLAVFTGRQDIKTGQLESENKLLHIYSNSANRASMKVVSQKFEHMPFWRMKK